MFLEDPFWRRIIRRVLAIAWIPTLAIAIPGIIGAGSRATVAGDVGAILLIYSILVIGSLVFGRPLFARIKKGEVTRRHTVMADIVEQEYQAKQAAKHSAKRHHEPDN